MSITETNNAAITTSSLPLDKFDLGDTVQVTVYDISTPENPTELFSIEDATVCVECLSGLKFLSHDCAVYSAPIINNNFTLPSHQHNRRSTSPTTAAQNYPQNEDEDDDGNNTVNNLLLSNDTKIPYEYYNRDAGIWLRMPRKNRIVVKSKESSSSNNTRGKTTTSASSSSTSSKPLDSFKFNDFVKLEAWDISNPKLPSLMFSILGNVQIDHRGNKFVHNYTTNSYTKTRIDDKYSLPSGQIYRTASGVQQTPPNNHIVVTHHLTEDEAKLSDLAAQVDLFNRNQSLYNHYYSMLGLIFVGSTFVLTQAHALSLCCMVRYLFIAASGVSLLVLLGMIVGGWVNTCRHYYAGVVVVAKIKQGEDQNTADSTSTTTGVVGCCIPFLHHLLHLFCIIAVGLCASGMTLWTLYHLRDGCVEC